MSGFSSKSDAEAPLTCKTRRGPDLFREVCSSTLSRRTVERLGQNHKPAAPCFRSREGVLKGDLRSYVAPSHRMNSRAPYRNNSRYPAKRSIEHGDPRPESSAERQGTDRVACRSPRCLACQLAATFTSACTAPPMPSLTRAHGRMTTNARFANRALGCSGGVRSRRDDDARTTWPQ